MSSGLIYAIVKLLIGKYNNYKIFENVFPHVINGLHLYVEYPTEYYDVNHYGPIFALVIAPFSILPEWLGMIFWILMTAQVVSKVRSSKLSNLDRMLGLFFGIVRACFLIILLNILISWIVPKESQSEAFRESRYFNLAGEFAEPIENLIPKATLDNIRSKTQNSDVLKEKDEEELEKVKIEKKEKTSKKSDGDELFEKLAKPRIEKAKKKQLEKAKEQFEGYNNNERANLDRLIDNIE